MNQAKSVVSMVAAPYIFVGNATYRSAKFALQVPVQIGRSVGLLETSVPVKEQVQTNAEDVHFENTWILGFSKMVNEVYVIVVKGNGSILHRVMLTSVPILNFTQRTVQCMFGEWVRGVQFVYRNAMGLVEYVQSTVCYTYVSDFVHRFISMLLENSSRGQKFVVHNAVAKPVYYTLNQVVPSTIRPASLTEEVVVESITNTVQVSLQIAATVFGPQKAYYMARWVYDTVNHTDAEIPPQVISTEEVVSESEDESEVFHTISRVADKVQCAVPSLAEVNDIFALGFDLTRAVFIPNSAIQEVKDDFPTSPKSVSITEDLKESSASVLNSTLLAASSWF